jgi:hypothetical protein
MKQAKGDGTTLQGDTTYWKNGTVLNDNAQGRSMADGNFVSAAFSALPVAGFRLQAANEVAIQYHENFGQKTGLVAFSDAERSTYRDINVWAPSAPNWFVHATAYPTGEPLTTARFGFNFAELSSYGVYCAVRWGWVGNESAGDADHNACGGLGAWGSWYGPHVISPGSTQLLGMKTKNDWNPATLYLWGR